MYITYCGMPQERKLGLKALKFYQEAGITSIQSYIFWNRIEKEPGVFNWNIYDEEVEYYKAHGIKWVPFIILGPYYTTPEWVRKATGEHYYKCLEHGRESKNISLWNTRFRPYIEKFMETFAQHYLPENVFETVLLGITGDYGEAIYPVFGNWPSDYHTHPGFWCGDGQAIEDYRKFLKSKFGNIAGLNAELGSNFNSIEEIMPVLRKKTSDKLWLTQMEWYRKSMNGFAEFWIETAKKYFVNTPVYLCTGGRGTNTEGSDFSLQAESCARFGAGIRITNESSDYLVNFISTRLMASACKFYGTEYGFEPCSMTTKKGMVSRVFNVLSSGAAQLYDYIMNNLEFTGDDVKKKDSFDILERYIPLLKSGAFSNPKVDVAVIIPGTQWTLDGETYPAIFIDKCKQLRMITDFDFIDEHMIIDGALNKYKYAITFFTRLVDDRIIPALIKWVDAGGIFITSSKIETVDGPSLLLDALLGLTGASDEVWGVQDNKILKPGFLINVLKTDKRYFTKHGYTNLSGSAIILANMESVENGASIWCNRYGNGLCFVYTGPMGIDLDTWMEDPFMYTRLIQDCLFHISAIDPLRVNLKEFNTDYNETYITQYEDGVLVLNFNNFAVRMNLNGREIILQPDEIGFIEHRVVT